MTDTMIARVARAMCADLGCEWGGQGLTRPEDYLSMATAALNALREPTNAMAEVGDRCVYVGNTDARMIFGAMIAAALI